MRRRTALSVLAGSLPLLGKPAKLKITSLEFSKIDGHREAVRGDRQHQVNPIHIYDELRPKPYREPQPAAPVNVPASALYLTIKSDAGVDGLYGPIDKEAAIVVDQQLRSFLTGKDALAVETVWDQMYRSNRHSARGHFMMAISVVLANVSGTHGLAQRFWQPELPFFSIS